jgi:Ca2+:H+ antiporter
MLVTLLTLAVGAMLVPTLAVHLETPAAHHTHALSDATAVILLLVYVASVPFWLSGGPTRRSPPGTARSDHSDRSADSGPGPNKQVAPADGAGGGAGRWPLGLAVTVLVLAGATSAFVSDWFVSALVPATTALGITPEFTGLVIVAIASNAVENFAGVRFAWKARSDYAISAILSSPLQIALLLTPVLVLGSAFFGHRQLTLVFPPLLVAALAIAVVVAAVVIYDGEYSWLEGVALIALYGIVATAFWWG